MQGRTKTEERTWAGVLAGLLGLTAMLKLLRADEMGHWVTMMI